MEKGPQQGDNLATIYGHILNYRSHALGLFANSLCRNHKRKLGLNAVGMFLGEFFCYYSIWLHYYWQINQKAAESLADPEEYPNLFDDWQIAFSVEAKAAEMRSFYLDNICSLI